MNKEVIITCAVTGAGNPGSHPSFPITPEEIANAAIEAANAGAAIAHLHVRNPKTGAASREFELYREVVERIRAVGTDMATATQRIAHIEKLLPEICTLDCGSLNFGDDYVYVSTPPMLREMAAKVKALNVKPELEVFEMGHLSFALQMLEEGLLEAPSLREPWTRLEAPELTDRLYHDMIDGFNESTKGRSMGELATELDDCLIRIIKVLEEYRTKHGIER